MEYGSGKIKVRDLFLTIYEISADPFESEDHIAMLEKRIADLKSKRNMHEHELIETE